MILKVLVRIQLIARESFCFRYHPLPHRSTWWKVLVSFRCGSCVHHLVVTVAIMLLSPSPLKLLSSFHRRYVVAVALFQKLWSLYCHHCLYPATAMSLYVALLCCCSAVVSCFGSASDEPSWHCAIGLTYDCTSLGSVIVSCCWRIA